VVKQYTENQYDDDLTLGTDEHDDSYYTDAEDLFELSTDDESPISRLKSLVLSIDWEITDEVLLQFNEELMDLKGIWAGEKINLVYLQALEKISKYIYQNKADSHPNAIKLFLTLYYNLEKIVSSHDLSEQQKKDILVEDVKRFENLKRLIKQKSHSAEIKKSEPPHSKNEAFDEDQLLTLKAIVLGIDWEITDQDLNDLRREVLRLEEKFADNRPRLILLQGIGTLGAYIKMKKSNAHADAFKVFHLFYESLEKIVKTPMTLEEVKAILFPAVEKFNAFKALLGPTISPEAVAREEDEEEDEEYSDTPSAEIAPALADIPDGEEIGFQAEDEAIALGLNDSSGMASHIDDFFGENGPSSSSLALSAKEEEILSPDNAEFSPNLMFPEEDAGAETVVVERDIALHGVDVEEDDDEITEESIVPLDDVVAFHSLDLPEEAADRSPTLGQEVKPAFAGMELQSEQALGLAEEDIVGATETLFPFEEPEPQETVPSYERLDREAALKGVDVESEADDDSEELSLPMEGTGPAPALVAMDEESIYSKTVLERAPVFGEVTDELAGTLDDLFVEQEKAPVIPVSAAEVEEAITGASGENQFGEETSNFEEWLKEGGEEDVVLVEPVEMEEGEHALEPDFAGEDESVLPRPLQTEEHVALTEALLGEQPEDIFSPLPPSSESDQDNKDIEEIENMFDSLQSDEEKFVFPVPASSDLARSEEQVTISEQEAAIVAAVVAVPEEEIIFELYVEEAGRAVDLVEPAVASGEPLLLAEGLAESTGGTLPDSAGAAIEAPRSKDLLDNLRACIDSLAIELEDKVIAGLFQEINMLREKWWDRPMEKTFLQLLSTITQHVDAYKYESSAEAHGLLHSVCQALAKVQGGNHHQQQEMLLTEILKVLQWQQNMLARQVVKRGSELVFADPLRVEQAVATPADALKGMDEQVEGEGVNVVSDFSLEAGGGGQFDDDAAGFAPPSAFNEEETKATEAELTKETFSDDLRREIALLRQTLQKEIADLRKELKNG
jgi:pilus assembly protein FimV